MKQMNSVKVCESCRDIALKDQNIHSVHGSIHAVPPTLLEDGQRY